MDPEVIDRFVAIAHRIVWCTVATVDRRGRPRSRVMHPVWERTEGGLVGWATARRTPLKRAHLARHPHVSCSYWDPAHDVAVAECEARWVQDPAEVRRVWALLASIPPPVGHDPHAIWPAGPEHPEAGLIRLDPWRLRAADAGTIARGEPAAVWRSSQAA